MPARLDPIERERRRRERVRASFAESVYRHYDPVTEGFGSYAEWEAAADAMASGRGTFKRSEGTKSLPVVTRDMAILGINTMPDDAIGLRSAFRKAALIAHPDKGGTEAGFKALMAAYERLMRNY